MASEDPMHTLLTHRRDQIAALCRLYGVRRLDVFGSALRDDFDASTSDVDLVVEFDQDAIGRGCAPTSGSKRILKRCWLARSTWSS